MRAALIQATRWLGRALVWLFRIVLGFAKAVARGWPHLLGLGLGLGFLAGWEPTFAWKGLTVLGVGFVWCAATNVLDQRIRHRIARRLRSHAWAIWVGAVVGVIGAAFSWLRADLSMAEAAVGLASAIAGVGLRRAFVDAVRTSRSLLGEALRWAVVVAAAIFVIQPYANRGLIGGGDAQHYAQQLADISAQICHGVFPVFVGQSAYAYNGDIHPLRTAPYFQYAGATLDFLTLHKLGPAGVLNLLIVLSLLAAGLTSYLLGVRVGGRRLAWPAALLAVTFVSSPGILALIYSGDMVASWMTLPYLPILIYGLVKLGEKRDFSGALVIPLALAALWLAHAPIAIWISLLVVMTAFPILAEKWEGGRGFWLAAGLVVIGSVFAGYVFVSVATLEVPNDLSLVNWVRTGGILNELRAGWAGWLKPVDPTGSNLLTDLQLSPVLWFAAVLGLLALGVQRKAMIPIWGFVILLLLLVYPSAVANRLWSVMPAAVIGATEKWPMQRFYPILSALVPFIALVALRHRWLRSMVARWLICLLLAVGCAWSLKEATKFLQRGRGVRSPIASTLVRLGEENAVLSRYSYEMYGRLPKYFSHGPMAPFLQNRLLAANTLEPSVTNLPAILHPAGGLPADTLHPYKVTDFGGQFTPKLRLEPGKTYVAGFDLGTSAAQGVLELIGRTIYRQYPMSPFVESQAFGEGSSRGFGIATDSSTGDEVDVRFYTTPGQPAPSPSASLQLVAVEPASLPLRLEQLIPYRVSTTTESPGWLETPKIFIGGYSALIDGQPAPVARSPDGLVMVPLSAGHHLVTLTYPGPWILRAAFWLTTIAWIALAVLLFLPRRWRELKPESLALLGRAGTVVAITALLGGSAAYAFSRPASAAKLAASEHFRARLILSFTRRDVSESIATLPQDTHAIALYAHFVNGQQVALGFSRDGAPWLSSAPVPINYWLPQDLDVVWGQAENNAPGRRRYRIVLNHRVILDRVAMADSPVDARSAGLKTFAPLPFGGRWLTGAPETAAVPSGPGEEFAPPVAPH